MTVLEGIFLITDALFPAKTPRSEREKLYHDIASLVPDIRTMTLVAPRDSYLRIPNLVPPHVELTDTLRVGEKTDALLIGTSPQNAIALVDAPPLLAPLIVIPVAFQQRYKDQPFYSALMSMLGAKGYSLFNLYNVTRRRGQIETAYALFIDGEVRDAFVKRIQS